MTMPADWEFRTGIRAGDSDRIQALVTATGFFSAEEVAIAVELAEDGSRLGTDSHYHFVVAECGGQLLGYACFGRIPGTAESWDLYWIAIQPGHQGLGIGRELLNRTEQAIQAAGGSRLYVDTSSRAQYAPTRSFYLRCNYQVAAELPDFFGPGDGKVIFVKVLVSSRHR